MGDGGVGVALWTTPGLYSFLYTSTTLYIYLSLRRAPCRGSTTLQPLQPSTTLYSYTAIHPLHSTTLYSTPLLRSSKIAQNRAKSLGKWTLQQGEVLKRGDFDSI